MAVAGRATAATFRASTATYPNAQAQFAPDGREVLVQTDVCQPQWGLAAAHRDGTLTQLVQGADPRVAVYSPDGKLVAYTTALELWVVPADGSAAPLRLATQVHGPAGFAWSPDGARIVFWPFSGGFGACEGG